MEIFPFNNCVETGMRTLCLLNSLYPRSFDLETLVCLDYLCVHTGDFDTSVKSLHPANPYRTGELYVRRSIIEEGLRLFIAKGLIEVRYDISGIEYLASDEAASFLDKVSASYSVELMERTEWVSSKLQELDKNNIQSIVKSVTADYAFQIMKR
mgnify:FL=1